MNQDELTKQVEYLMGGVIRQSMKERKIPSKNISEWWISGLGKGVESFKSTESSGKWCIFVDKSEVDECWKKIVKVLSQGKLMSAKVATAKGAERYKGIHVICVYTKDYKDENELMHSRQVLTDLGFVEPLRYKRDVDTMNGVYGENEFYLTR